VRFFLALLLSMTFALSRSAAPNGRTLDIYVVDVEGGKAELIVTPSRESLLIDSGNAGEAAPRDVQRIMAAINDAGLKQIDHLVTTHWHRDHFGGIESLAARIPIREFIDHGPNQQPDPMIDDFLRGTYPRLYSKAAHRVVRPGEKIPIAGLDVTVIASAGEVIGKSLSGIRQPNPYCSTPKPPVIDHNENEQSIALHMQFGRLRIIDPGDLAHSKEFDLMCPDNRIGHTDLFMVSHHGQTRSNIPALVHAIEARVAIMDNGRHKGGEPEVMKVLYSAPRLENLWQLQYSQLSGAEYNPPGLFIANLDEKHGTSHWIKVSAREDGSFTVTNTRNGFAKAYPAPSD
jgi:beta-lactamase superfamily II metal-dependent hydrolase